MDYTKEQIIEELGLSNMPAEKQDALIGAVYSTLNMRVGMAIADKLSDEQLEQMKEASGDNDEKAMNWLMQNVPDYKSVIDEEMKSIIDEIKQRTDKIVQG